MADHQPRNESVDTFRMLAALCVIIVHVDFYTVPRTLVVAAKLMSFWVIPFFFVLSGYFLAEKSARTKSLDVQSLIERMGWVFIIWTLLYLPTKMNRNSLGFFGTFDLMTSGLFIYYGDYYHLWYLSAMVMGSLFIAVCYRYNARLLIPIFSVIAIFVSLMAAGYQIFDIDFTQKSTISIPKFWRAIPLIYAGFLIYRRGIPSWKLSAFLVVVGTAMLPLEVKFIRDIYGHPAYQELLLGTLPAGIGMACLALNNLKFLQHPRLAQWGREYSLGIYLIHPMIIYPFRNLLIQYMPVLLRSPIWEIIFPVFVLALCLAVLIASRRYIPVVYNFVFGVSSSPRQS